MGRLAAAPRRPNLAWRVNGGAVRRDVPKNASPFLAFARKQQTAVVTHAHRSLQQQQSACLAILLSVASELMNGVQQSQHSNVANMLFVLSVLFCFVVVSWRGEHKALERYSAEMTLFLF